MAVAQTSTVEVRGSCLEKPQNRAMGAIRRFESDDLRKNRGPQMRGTALQLCHEHSAAWLAQSASLRIRGKVSGTNLRFSFLDSQAAPRFASAVQPTARYSFGMASN